MYNNTYDNTIDYDIQQDCTIFDIFPLSEIDKKYYGITENDINAVIDLYNRDCINFDKLSNTEKSVLQYLCDIGYIN